MLNWSWPKTPTTGTKFILLFIRFRLVYSTGVDIRPIFTPWPRGLFRSDSTECCCQVTGRVRLWWHTAMLGKGNEGATGEWTGYPARFALPRSIASPAQYKCYQLTRTPRLPIIDWTVAPAESHGLVRSTERRNLVSARVPSHLKFTLFLRHIRKFPSPYLVPQTGCFDWSFHGLRQFPVTGAGVVIQIRSRSPPFTPFPISCALLSLPFEST
jgi:hypothetical protein